MIRPNEPDHLRRGPEGGLHGRGSRRARPACRRCGLGRRRGRVRRPFGYWTRRRPGSPHNPGYQFGAAVGRGGAAALGHGPARRKFVSQMAWHRLRRVLRLGDNSRPDHRGMVRAAGHDRALEELSTARHLARIRTLAADRTRLGVVEDAAGRHGRNVHLRPRHRHPVRWIVRGVPVLADLFAAGTAGRHPPDTGAAAVPVGGGRDSRLAAARLEPPGATADMDGRDVMSGEHRDAVLARAGGRAGDGRSSGQGGWVSGSAAMGDANGDKRSARAHSRRVRARIPQRGSGSSRGGADGRP